MKTKLILLICLACNICMAQTIPIDLSKNLNQTFSQTIQPQKFEKIKLLNRVISTSVEYGIEVKKEFVLANPITLPKDIAASHGSAGGACDPIEKAMDALKEEDQELAIPNRLTLLQSEIDKANCTTEIVNAKKLIELTTESINLPFPIEIKRGEKITITITRDASKKWTYIFQTEAIDHGRIFYGFSYLFSNTLTHFPTYYTHADSDTTFMISKSNNTTKNVLKNISPTLMYSYVFFNEKPNSPLKFGLTGGFMLDLTNPSVMFSPSLIIGDNISLNLGIAFTQKDQLRGQYSEGQRLNLDLDFDQLHHKIWTYDLLFSVGFRFDSNPFKKQSATDSSN